MDVRSLFRDLLVALLPATSQVMLGLLILG